MPDNKFSLDSYVTVAERVAAFIAKHPEGSLQSEIVTMTETLVVMKAYAYRTPDDVRPGIGHSGLEIPGKTPYTRGSELENAESSAVGRAIAALGFEVKRGIATQNEIDNKREPEQRMKAPTNAEVEAERDRMRGPQRPLNEVDDLTQSVIKDMAEQSGPIARTLTLRFLTEKGYPNWADFLARGNDDAAELIHRLDPAQPEPVVPA